MTRYPNTRRDPPPSPKPKRKGLRREYVKESQLCQICGKRMAEECHEIARGIHRAEAVKHRECWLALCVPCHNEVGDYSKWPLTRQLAQKLLADPKFFDLKMFNILRDRAEDAITLEEVVKHLEMK